MSSFFVAGTDTNVGKTTATRAIIQALQNKVCKWLAINHACCCEESIYPAMQEENTSDYDNLSNQMY